MNFQAGAHWLAGLERRWRLTKLTDQEEALLLNWTHVLNLAIDNLHKCLWFGIFEEMDKSMEMFRYQTGLKAMWGERPQRYKQHSYPPPSQYEVERIEKLMPVDMYFYKYAKQLYQHRWNWYQRNIKNNTSIDPEKDLAKLTLPEVIDGCVRTPTYLKCGNETFYLNPKQIKFVEQLHQNKLTKIQKFNHHEKTAVKKVDFKLLLPG